MTLIELLRLLRKHLVFLVVVTLVGALVGVGASFLKQREDEAEDTYTSKTTMYVSALVDGDSSDASSQDTSYSVESDGYYGLQSNGYIAYDTIDLIKSERVRKEVEEDVGLDSLDDYTITVTASSYSPRLISITVEGEDPQMAADIANSLAENGAKLALDVMQVPSVDTVNISVVDRAEPEDPDEKDDADGTTDEDEDEGGLGRYLAVGLLGGLFVAVALVVAKATFDTRVRTASELEELIKVPVVGSFRNMKE